MPGMNSGLSDTNPIIVAAFRAALMHQGLIVLALLLGLGLAWAGVREWLPAARRASESPWSAAGLGLVGGPAEPRWRRVLRIGFGIPWIFGGILQAQATVGWQSAQWRTLPPLPAQTATLAAGPGGQPLALAVRGLALAAWQLAAGSSRWTLTQTVQVPVPIGTSG